MTTTRRPTPPPDERLYTIREVAELWAVSRDMVERHMRNGELRFVQVSERRRRIPASALAEFTDSH